MSRQGLVQAVITNDFRAILFGVETLIERYVYLDCLDDGLYTYVSVCVDRPNFIPATLNYTKGRIYTLESGYNRFSIFLAGLIHSSVRVVCCLNLMELDY